MTRKRPIHTPPWVIRCSCGYVASARSPLEVAETMLTHLTYEPPGGARPHYPLSRPLRKASHAR